MADMRSDIVALLREEFDEEAEAGFPRLRRIPQTKVTESLERTPPAFVPPPPAIAATAYHTLPCNSSISR